MVQSRVSAGKKVRLVNMFPALKLPGDYSVDGTHPNESGFLKMANIWLPGIQAFADAGQIVPAQQVTNYGKSAVPSSGKCADLTA